jgi:hypothetical protein
MAEAGLPGEIVEMLHDTLQDILQSWVGTLTVNELDIVGDVIDGEVFQRRNIDL